MVTINSYLNFNGNCEEAFNFYRSVFGGDFAHVGRFGDMPPSEEANMSVSEADKDKIMHISLPISKETLLMGCDNPEAYRKNNGFSNFSLSVNTESKEEADKIFNALSGGGKVTMPMEQTFWGSYFGMATDKFGLSWMVGFDEKQDQ